MANLMSFSVTPQELLRVKFFLIAGKKLDPRGASDLIMVFVFLAIYLFNFAAVLFMLWNRKYPPLKSKNPILMTFIFLSSIFWFAGDLQVNGHAPLKGTPFVHCKFFGVWMHVLMGVSVMSSLIGLRSYGLYRVFCKGRPFRGVALYVSVIITVLVMLAYGIITQALPEPISVYYMDYVDVCFFHAGYRAGLITFVWVNWAAVIAINWRIRHINCSFNETREIFLACVVVFLVLIGMTTLSYVVPEFALDARYRILATSMNHFGAITVWWLIMYKPLYECLTNRQRYLDEWMRKLRQDGQQEAYHYDAGSLIGNTTLRGDYSYVQNKQESHRLTVLGESGYNNDFDNKGTVIGNTACDEAIIETTDMIIGCDRVTSQVSSPQPDSPVCSHNGDIELAIHRNNSSSNLVEFSASAPPPVPPKRSVEISTARWPRPPPPVSNKKPWEKLGSVVDRFGAPATSSSLPTSTKPYTPIIHFPEPAATRPLRRNPTQDSNLDDPFSPNKRRLI
ncbi:hypothetical protein GGI19_000506 [Coemansia pectinata]|uniref:G-protein coupled receptors family 3 profile domain-containing protein n=1 Tax=Coemansia pectinata TaxID=1052879 RepID=A0A9W8GZ98_9FUNG|nr:hypothetical protein GGI19_000506 [Coemansia pectinata]